MSNIGIWNISSGSPLRLRRGAVNLERDLEEWIERDPDLLKSGLTIIGRQIAVDAGLIDLLALDPSGTWVVIEVKRGNVRRKTVTQAIDYAACLDGMSIKQIAERLERYLHERGTTLTQFVDDYGLEADPPTRENTAIIVVGTTREAGLERMIRFLAGGIQIEVVTFEVFEAGNGQTFIVRALTELEPGDIEESDTRKESDNSKGRGQAISLDGLATLAEQNGIGPQFDLLREAALRHGFYPRTYVRSVMYAPPAYRTRMLFTVWVKPRKGLMRVYVGVESFSEFYGVSEEDVVSALGEDGWHKMDLQRAREFVNGLDRLLGQPEQD